MYLLDVGPKWRKNNKFHCHLLQQHARLETRGPSTTLLGTTWPPSGLSAHLSFIIINAKRGSGPLWRDCYWEIQLRAGPLRVHSGPLGSTCLSLLWGRQIRFESTRIHLGPLCGEPYGEIKLKPFRTCFSFAADLRVNDVPESDEIYFIRCGFESQRRSRERRNLLIAKGLFRIIFFLLI